jgi:hypothetical protein
VNCTKYKEKKESKTTQNTPDYQDCSKDFEKDGLFNLKDGTDLSKFAFRHWKCADIFAWLKSIGGQPSAAPFPTDTFFVEPI